MIEAVNFCIPDEGASFLRDIEELHRAGEDVFDGFASGRLRYIQGGATDTFPNEGLDRILNWAVRYCGSANILRSSGSVTTHTNAAPPEFTTSANHNLATGDLVEIAGQTPTVSNGVWAITVTAANKFTIPLNAAPGAQTVAGTWRAIGGPLKTQYLGLYTSQSSTTVPADTVQLTGSGSGTFVSGTMTEATSSGGYARTAITEADFGGDDDSPAIADAPSSVGRRITVPGTGVSFTPSSGAYSGAANGFFLATKSASTAQNTGIALFYANFSDDQNINVNAAGYTVRLAPYVEFDH